MQASELRVGNIVETLHTNGSPEQWIKIEIDPIHILTCKLHPDWFRPIPLSRDILKEIGFRYRAAGCGGQDSWAGYGSWQFIGDDNFNFLGNAKGDQLFFGRVHEWEYKHVHEIQNLYASLTRGKKLGVNNYPEWVQKAI